MLVRWEFRFFNERFAFMNYSRYIGDTIKRHKGGILMSRGIQYLDYAVQGNVIVPLVYLDSEQFDTLINDYDSVKMYLKQVRRKKRGA